jgi:hypothetical protein
MTDRVRGVGRKMRWQRQWTGRCLSAAFVLLLAPALAFAQESQSRSSEVAVELAKLLDTMKLDAIAAKIEGDQYVGALYFPGSQLLVVKARYIVPERMDAQLQGRNYRDVYIDLNSASIKDSKTLIADLGANGLQLGRRNQPYDTVDTGGKSIAFDGDWGKAKISEQEYTKAFEANDAEYTRMLQVLVAQLKKTS